MRKTTVARSEVLGQPLFFSSCLNAWCEGFCSRKNAWNLFKVSVPVVAVHLHVDSKQGRALEMACLSKVRPDGLRFLSIIAAAKTHGPKRSSRSPRTYSVLGCPLINRLRLLWNVPFPLSILVAGLVHDCPAPSASPDKGVSRMRSGLSIVYLESEGLRT